MCDCCPSDDESDPDCPLKRLPNGEIHPHEYGDLTKEEWAEVHKSMMIRRYDDICSSEDDEEVSEDGLDENKHVIIIINNDGDKRKKCNHEDVLDDSSKIGDRLYEIPTKKGNPFEQNLYKVNSITKNYGDIEDNKVIDVETAIKKENKEDINKKPIVKKRKISNLKKI